METSATVERWQCPNCRAPAASPFCPTCGERPVRPFDLSLKGLLAQAAKVSAASTAGLVRSVRALVVRPGSLTQAYVEGRRKPFVGPFQLFVLANLAFFAAQSLSRTKIFSSTLDSHLHRQDWSELAQAMVARHVAATGTPLDAMRRSSTTRRAERQVPGHPHGPALRAAAAGRLLASRRGFPSTSCSRCTCTRSSCCSSASRSASRLSTRRPGRGVAVGTDGHALTA